MSQAANAIRPLPEPALSVDEAAERHEQLMEFVRTCMKRGQDYGATPGQQDRFMLLKPGAEKLGLFYGLSPLVEVINRVEDWNPAKGTAFCSYEVKVTLINKRTKAVEGEGLGSCNSRERKYAKQDAPNIANTILKMAKKRALVDATTQATASSGLFASGDPGEDLDAPQPESYQQPRRENRGTPPQQPRPPAPRPPQRPPAPQEAAEPVAQLLISPAQLKQYNETRDRALALGLQVPGTLSMASTVGKWNARMEMLRAALAGAGDPEAALLAVADEEPAGGVRYTIPRNAVFKPCQSCRANITFVPTGKGGGAMPCNPDGTPHFATCPNAAAHRAPSQAGNGQRVATETGGGALALANDKTLPPHVRRLWAVIGEAGLPAAKAGKQRDNRLTTCNDILMNHDLLPVESFKELDPQRAQLLCHYIQGGHVPSWDPRAVAA